VPGGDARSLSQDAQEALRIRGVRMLEAGFSQVEVAEALGVGERQVRRWQKRFRQGGWKALAKRRRGRRPGEQEALSAAQQQQIVAAIRSQNPDQLRIGALLWTRSSVRELIERDCGVLLEVGTVGRYLRRWGFTLKRPTRRALEADPVVVEAWLSDVYPQIKAQARKDGGVILWQDESGLRLDRLVAKQGYAPRGQRAIAPATGSRQGVNMISALANSGELRFSVFEGRFTARVFIDFLERLIRSIPGRKIHLICTTTPPITPSSSRPGSLSAPIGSSCTSSPPTAPSSTPTSSSTRTSSATCARSIPSRPTSRRCGQSSPASSTAANANHRSSVRTSGKHQSATPPRNPGLFAAHRDIARAEEPLAALVDVLVVLVPADAGPAAGGVGDPRRVQH
jgi:transposase